MTWARPPRLLSVALLLAVLGGAEPARALRVATFNMLHGGLDSGWRGDAQHLDIRLELAARDLDTLEADVIALQEASIGRARGNLADRLGAKLGLPHVVLASPGDWLGRLAAAALGFDEGPAILSRLPLRALRSDRLERCGEILRRALVCAEIVTQDGPVTACSTHVDGSACQLGAVATALDEACPSAPLVLMGDLNTTSDSPSLGELIDRLGLVDAFRTANPAAPGFTVWQPVTEPRPLARRRVDYILVRPGGGRTLTVRASRVVLDRPHATDVGILWASDHYAVVADLVDVPHADAATSRCRQKSRDPGSAG
jgi:endonuclease/exonuclease/phosphatase family metal-dependent hydrolase